ncbi:MAG: hypothetical protein PHS44_04620 [Candidatus Dojkabacteria bacterium]|nr:hypothetical protein [Candidatus Dojkabacteria bacterium]
METDVGRNKLIVPAPRARVVPRAVVSSEGTRMKHQEATRIFYLTQFRLAALFLASDLLVVVSSIAKNYPAFLERATVDGMLALHIHSPWIWKLAKRHSLEFAYGSFGPAFYVVGLSALTITGMGLALNYVQYRRRQRNHIE